MGWGSGNGKGEVLNPAAGEPTVCGSAAEHPFNGKLVLIDVSGLGHKVEGCHPPLAGCGGWGKM